MLRRQAIPQKMIAEGKNRGKGDGFCEANS
jgi:hypothetical protein